MKLAPLLLLAACNTWDAPIPATPTPDAPCGAIGVVWSGAANITSTASTQFPMVQYTAGAARLVGSFQIT